MLPGYHNCSYLLNLLYITVHVLPNTVKPALKDRATGHKMWSFKTGGLSLVTGSTTLKYRTLCQKYLVFQSRVLVYCYLQVNMPLIQAAICIKGMT